MGKVLLRDALIIVNGVDLSDHASQVEVATDRDSVDISAFTGAGYRENGAGFGDATITVTFFQDYAAASVHATLQPIYDAGSAVEILTLASRGVVSDTNPAFVMIGRLFDYSPLAAIVGDAATMEVTFRNADPTGLYAETTVADFFVDSEAGSDSFAGTLLRPFRTLSKLQSSIGVNNTAALKRGSRWRQTFTVPANGITLTAYGPPEERELLGSRLDVDTFEIVPYHYITNAPVIDGGEYVTGWTPYTSGVSDSWLEDDFAGTSGANVTTSTPEIGAGAWSSAVGTAVISSDGMARRGDATTTATYKFSGPPSVADYAVESVVRVKTLETVDLATNIARMNPSALGDNVFFFSALGVSAGAGFVRTGWQEPAATFFDIPFTVAAATTYTLRTEVEGTVIRTYVNGVLIDTRDSVGSKNGNFSDSTGNVGFKLGSGSTPVGGDAIGMQITSIKCLPLNAPGTAVNTYQATLAADPLIVDLEGQYSSIGVSANLLEDGENLHKDGVLYVRRDAGQPSNTMVVAGARDNAIVGGTRTNVTLHGIAVEHTRQQAISWVGGSGLRLEQVMSQICTGSFSVGRAVFHIAAHAGLVVDGCVLRNFGGDGIYQATGGTSPELVDCWIGPGFGIQSDCYQHDGTGAINGRVHGCKMVVSPLTPKGCILVQGDGFEIDNNDLGGGRNFLIAAFGNNIVVHHNLLHDVDTSTPSAGGGFEIVDNTPAATTGASFHHNVLVDCNPALRMFSSIAANRANLNIYNNTIVNIGTAPTAWQVALDQPISGNFKNNILWDLTGTGKAVRVTSVIAGQTWNSDYNLIGPEHTGFLEYAGTAYNLLQAFIMGTAKDGRSITSDPLFAAIGGRLWTDYGLAAGSPAQDRAVVVAGINDNVADGFPDLGALERATPLTVSAAPTVINAPTIYATTGDPTDPVIGTTVACAEGAWTGRPTGFTYQWKRNGSNIGGATTSTYVVQVADNAQALTCAVTATNGIGSSSATSNTISVSITTFFDDQFTGVLNTNLDLHTADSGDTWTRLSGTGAENKLSGDGCVYRPAGATIPIFKRTTTMEDADYQIDCVINIKSLLASDAIQIFARTVDAINNYQAVILQDGSISIRKIVVGALTTLCSGTVSVAVGSHTMSLRVVGSTLTLLWDGVVVTATSGTNPIADGSFSAAGSAGLKVGFNTSTVQTASTGMQADRFTVTEA